MRQFKDDMNTIENAADFIKWAKHINNNIGIMKIEERCDMQDIFGHSAVEKINNAFAEAVGERKLIICSVNNVMSFQAVEDLLSHLANHKIKAERKELYAEIDKREANLDARERTFKDMLKPYHKRLAEMKHKISMLETQSVSLQRLADNRLEETRKARKDANEYHEKAIKLDAIRAALA